MPLKSANQERIEFGDFQTPFTLARLCADRLRSNGLQPSSIFEPTCGEGAFLIAALESFPGAERVVGMDINPVYIDGLRATLATGHAHRNAAVVNADFYAEDWVKTVAEMAEPILAIGNPPWVTNSQQGVIGGSNLPRKANAAGMKGIDAVTGKSNFDVSEWILCRLVTALSARTASIAMLCKTSVARKVLAQIWREELSMSKASVFFVDAKQHFDVAVDACFLVLDFSPEAPTDRCDIYASPSSAVPSSSWGWRDGIIVSNASDYDRYSTLLAVDNSVKWRSGIKHDCSKVMELRRLDKLRFQTGNNEIVSLESDFLFPALKSSDLQRPTILEPRIWMLVPQRFVGQDTAYIHHSAPLTWSYLTRNAQQFVKRASSIYRNKPPFSIFGVGEYSFTPWKVAISSMYKQLNFVSVGPFNGKPVVFDDTVNFLPCSNQDMATQLNEMLLGQDAQRFLSSIVFWDAKRPITVDLLRRLDLELLATFTGRVSLAEELGRLREMGSQKSQQARLAL